MRGGVIGHPLSWLALQPVVLPLHVVLALQSPAACQARDNERAAQSSLLRDLFGNLFRSPSPIDSSIQRWNDGCVLKLAKRIYQERCLPAGTLDRTWLAILADALEDASYQDEEVLSHLRQQEGVHVCGCYVLDFLLNKE
jgi:hypothetical protein